MPATFLIGALYGDEGKGRVAAVLAGKARRITLRVQDLSDPTRVRQALEARVPWVRRAELEATVRSIVRVELPMDVDEGGRRWELQAWPSVSDPSLTGTARLTPTSAR